MHLSTRLFVTAIILSLTLFAQQEKSTATSTNSPAVASTNTPSAETTVALPSLTLSLPTNQPISQPVSNSIAMPPVSAPNPSAAQHVLSTNALARLKAVRAKLQNANSTLRVLETNSIPSNNILPIASSNAPLSTLDLSSLTNAAPTTLSISTNATNAPAGITLVNPNEKVSIQFPHTSVLEVLSLYEKLTGKRIIRDSNLTGPDLSIMVADPVSKKDAINILESSMLLNGYYIVPVDEKTIKVLGPGRPPRTEGLPLYLEESKLPVDGDKLVSFYQPLHFLSPAEAINIVQGVVQLNPYASLVAVPNTSAIVITDKTPVIRKALALLKVIDHESSQIITEFIPLQRANAEKTVETLNQIFGKESSTPSSTSPTAPPKNPQAPNNPAVSADASTPGDERVFSGKVQFIADKRTNRILVVTRAENYRYVRELISKLDQAQQLEEPLVRPLNYMSANDIFPVLVQMLKNKDDDSTENPANQQNSQNGARSNSSPGSAGSQNPAGGAGSSGSPGSIGSSTGGSSTGGTSAPDRLSDAAQLAPPQSAVIGSTSLVADPTANTIIVYGPPENKAKAGQIIDLLDRRPQQVYLAAVIGEMTLSEGMDYGASYLLHYDGFNAIAHSFLPANTQAGSALANGVNSVFPNTADPNGLTSSSAVRANGISNAISNHPGGLTMFGSIGGSVDMYANFLESTGKFRTISRPVVYTSNNKKATILSGQRIPYQSSTLSSVVASSSATNTANAITANVTYQDVLLKLEVIPLINSDKEVNLIIAQQNQSVDKAATTQANATGVNAPVINTQELTTSVRIPSGSTIVLGGLITDEKDNNELGIPYINKIPIIGPLLGSHTAKNKNRSELVVMIQPIVIDSDSAMEKASNKEGGTSDLGMKTKELEKKLQPPPPPPKPAKKKFKLFQLPKQENF